MKQNFAQTTCSSDFLNKKLKIILFYYLHHLVPDCQNR